MKFLIAIAALVAVVAADCDILQRLTVKQQWATMYASGNMRADFNTELWKEFFRIKPDALALFDRVNGENIYSPEFRAHMARVDTGLDQCFALLDDQAVLDAQLAHLKTQHEALGVGADMFEAWGKALLEVSARHHGMCFEQEAWKECYGLIATGITG